MAKEESDGSKSVTAQYSSFLPHPKILERFEMLCPGATKDIFEMAKLEQKHRHSMDRGKLRSNVFGQVTSFAILGLGICGAVYLIANGKSAEGLALVLTPLAGIGGLVYAFRAPVREQMKKAASGRDDS